MAVALCSESGRGVIKPVRRRHDYWQILTSSIFRPLPLSSPPRRANWSAYRCDKSAGRPAPAAGHAPPVARLVSALLVTHNGGEQQILHHEAENNDQFSSSCIFNTRQKLVNFFSAYIKENIGYNFVRVFNFGTRQEFRSDSDI